MMANLIPALLLVIPLATAVASADSVVRDEGTEGEIHPAYRIEHPRLKECSGIVWHDGAFYAHNDSGDDPVLYRSRDGRFLDRETEVLPVPDAEAVDWEDIATFEGDLLIGDIGDNRRQRSHLTLYRVRYVDGDDGSRRLELVATYPFRYPDRPHNAEALAVVDGKVQLITKALGEPVTNVYVFDRLCDARSLPPGEMNVPRFSARLEIGDGQQVTAADYDPETGTILLLTYTHLLHYPRHRLSGPPAASTLIAARQSEALCFRASQIVFTNEQRDVFVVDRFLSRGFKALLPERGRTTLPTGEGSFEIDGTGRSWHDRGSPIPLSNAGEDEEMRWSLVGDHLLIHGRLEYIGEFRFTSTDPPRLGLGSGVLFAFAHDARLALSGEELQIAVGLSQEEEPVVWRMDLTANPAGMNPLAGVPIDAEARDGVFTFEMALPLEAGLKDHLGDRFLFDVHGVGLHGREEVRFSGIDRFTLMRPYLWGEVTQERSAARK
jgi:hypothetical protein